MKTVWKFELPLEDYVELLLPKGSISLSVQVQGNNLQLWCLCNPEEPLREKRVFRIVGTGHYIEEKNISFIDTFQMMNGDFAFHVFEVWE
jgi:hypothetical protein